MCQIITFGKEHGSDLLSSNNVENKQHFKYLSAHIDKKWSLINIQELFVPCWQGSVVMFTKLDTISPEKKVIVLYNSFAKSGITYGVLVYGTQDKSRHINLWNYLHIQFYEVCFRDKRVSKVFKRVEQQVFNDCVIWNKSKHFIPSSILITVF